MKHPFCDIMICDEMVRQYLPQIRAEVVSRMIMQKGITQKRVAIYMGLTPAAVSQYVSRKRGCKAIEISQELDEVIEQWTQSLVNGDRSVTICDICRCVQKEFRK
ncbi:transcriptional regulator [Methanogenium organophilum]|uniref:Transcriptional regulator n=1 Tax=Methanogenium organophilum TaxID=2199 RepID=A0A9X9T856_METOG|nr:transcriptional regulator [Methanogenium organophilum]WAI00822.1 transcriptional regulator [Methanogenium organophilum]